MSDSQEKIRKGYLMIQFLDRPIAFHRAFIGIGCGATGAIMLSQAVYWSKRSDQNGGWFYKTQAEWEDETGLTRYEQETARKKLRKLGVLDEVKRGVPCKVFYRVNEEALEALLFQYAEKQQPSSRQSNTTASGNTTGSDAVIPQTNTETTHRLPETTTDMAAKAAKPKKRKSRLPDEFKPTEQHYKMAEEKSVDLNHEFQQFKDYHNAKGSTMVDWHAALRTWIRNAAKFQQSSGKQKRPGYMRDEKLDYSKGVNPDGTF